MNLKLLLSASIYYFSQFCGLDRWFSWSEATQLGFNGLEWPLSWDSSPCGRLTFKRLLWAGTHNCIKVPSRKLAQVSMGQHFSSLCLHHTFYPLICQSKSHSQDQSQYGKQLPKGMHTGWGDLLQPFLYISYQRKEEVKYLNQDLISNNQARVRRSACTKRKSLYLTWYQQGIQEMVRRYPRNPIHVWPQSSFSSTL